jgi:hypothetical protein
MSADRWSTRGWGRIAAAVAAGAIAVGTVDAPAVASAHGHRAGPAAYPSRRVGGVSGIGLEGVRPALGADRPARALRTPSRVVTTTVDSDTWTGYENAVYAASDSTVLVAYKRFTEDPHGGGYNAAELRVARSDDGGRTWTHTVVDPSAPEQGDTIDNSVSIDGNHGSVVYVAYHTRASGLFADMKLKVAKSIDGGQTWTVSTIADGYAGDYNGIRVLSPDGRVVAISAHADGPEEGIHAYLSTNGGVTWTDSLVAGNLGDGLYSSVGGASLSSMLVGWYNALYPDNTDLEAGRRSGPGWTTQVVDGTPGDPDITGLGASVWVQSQSSTWIAYEADTTLGTFVRVARFTPGSGWTIVPVQQAGTIGWNTAIHATDASHVYTSYWYYDGSKGYPTLATSADGGMTWTPFTIQDPRTTQPYLDSTAPSTSFQFISYQTTDQDGNTPLLRVAVVRH